MTTISDWKARLDEVRTLDEAESVIADALRSSDGEELATFLIDLFREFVGPDSCGGGECATKDRMERAYQRLVELGYNTQDRFNREGENFANFQAIIRHG